MSVYVPKAGDRVRATLGENVLVGTWYGAGGGYRDRILLDSGRVVAPEWDGWRFEQVVEVPGKFGAVIRRVDGTLFTRREVGTNEACWANALVSGLDTDQATVNGFTVLFEGVDE